MKKQTKKLLSWVLTGALALGLVANVNVSKVDADDTADVASASAFLVYGDASWAVGNWSVGGATASDAAITEDGTYTVVFNNPGDGELDVSNVFCVDIPKLKKKVEKFSDVKVSDVKVALDGKDIDVDQSKIIAKDVEDNYNMRIEIFNQYGATSKDAPIDSTLKWKESLAVTFTISGLKFVKTADYKFYDRELWATPGIHGYLSFQTPTWDYRDGFYPSSTGKNSFNSMQVGGQAIIGDLALGVDAHDVYFTKDGEYEVSITGDFDLTAASSFNFLGVATDLDSEKYAGVKISNITCKSKVGDKEIPLTESPIESIAPKADEGSYYFSLQNNWDDGAPLNAANAKEELTMPDAGLTIKFTISGLKDALQDLKDGNYVDPETGEKVKSDLISQEDIDSSVSGAGGTTNVTPTNPPSTTNKPNTGATAVGPKNGAKKTVKNIKYQVTKRATTKAKGEVKVIGLNKKAKKAKKITIPATVKLGKGTFKVTVIAKNGLKGAKAKNVVLGKNVKTIQANAFNGCKKLSGLKLNAKLKTVKKNAFKGCKKTIKVTGKSKKANVKALKKSGYKKFK